jgi:K+-sensing histidine kinase KdpD
MTMTDWLAVVALLVSVGSLVVSIASAVIAARAKKQAMKAATLEQRTEAINHIRHAMYDTHKDGNITNKTISDIQRAAHLSRLVFNDSITQTVERARTISDLLQHTPSERQNERYEQDKDALKRCLEGALDLMNKEASFSG